MAHTDTDISNLKINRGTKAIIDANLSSIGENELIFLTDKSIPIPADKVGAADSVDKGKVVSVNANGNYELITPASPASIDPTLTLPDYAADAKATGDAIRDVNKVIDDTMEIVIGKNICPPTVFDGYLEPDGSLTIYDDWKTTDFISVESSTSIVTSAAKVDNTRETIAMWFFIEYDANHDVIQQIVSQGPTYTVAAGVKYIRFSYHTNIYHDIMTESGTTATEYVPYFEKYVIKSDAIREWTGIKWTAIGDSLTEVNLRTDINYIDYISEKTGISCVNLGHSGVGYMRGYDGGNAFYQRALYVPTDSDIVTIFGSGNDLLYYSDLGDPSDSGTSTICGCINATLDNILTTFMTDSKVPVIGVITPTPWVGSDPGDAADSMTTYCDAIIACCKARSIPVLDLYRCSNLHPNDATFRTLAYSKDEGNGVHPDETGHKIIAPMIENFLKSLILSV